MNESHVAEVAALEAMCFSEPWSEKSVASELTNPLSLWLVALEGENVIGYVGSQTVMGWSDMMNVAVHPDHRRLGVGKALIEELKAEARKQGYRPENAKIYEVKDAELRQVSVERLVGRLGLKKYDVSAPLAGSHGTKCVKIPLLQHIGAPSEPTVKERDKVRVGDLIARAKEGALGVNIHASIDGTVESVTEKFIKIIG